jgi:S1-C subfamily serine protease
LLRFFRVGTIEKCRLFRFMHAMRFTSGIIWALAPLVALTAPATAQLWLPGQKPQPVMSRPEPLSRPPEPNTVHREKTGTAFFVDDFGAMLTARHAVEDCERVIVAKEGRAVAARVLALSPSVDLALIKVPKTLGLAAVFPRTVTTSANDVVFVSAYDKLPAKTQLGGMLANATVSSNAGGSDTWYLAIDSDVTFGASGAPVLDSRGLVKGVISRRTTTTRVLAVAAAESKAFLASNNIHFSEDDRPQLAVTASRANRAASISARVTCLQN